MLTGMENPSNLKKRYCFGIFQNTRVIARYRPFISVKRMVFIRVIKIHWYILPVTFQQLKVQQREVFGISKLMKKTKLDMKNVQDIRLAKIICFFGTDGSNYSFKEWYRVNDDELIKSIGLKAGLAFEGCRFILYGVRA